MLFVQDTELLYPEKNHIWLVLCTLRNKNDLTYEENSKSLFYFFTELVFNINLPLSFRSTTPVKEESCLVKSQVPGSFASTQLGCPQISLQGSV
jgi:hypothetical protein